MHRDEVRWEVGMVDALSQVFERDARIQQGDKDMKLTRFIFRPRWQSLWIRALSESAMQDDIKAQPKPAAPTVQRPRTVQIHCVEHV